MSDKFIAILEEEVQLDEKFGDIIDSVHNYFSEFKLGHKRSKTGHTMTIDADPMDHDSIHLGISEVMKKHGYKQVKGDSPTENVYTKDTSIVKVNKPKKSRQFELAFNHGGLKEGLDEKAMPGGEFPNVEQVGEEAFRRFKNKSKGYSFSHNVNDGITMILKNGNHAGTFNHNTGMMHHDNIKWREAAQ